MKFSVLSAALAQHSKAGTAGTPVSEGCFRSHVALRVCSSEATSCACADCAVAGLRRRGAQKPGQSWLQCSGEGAIGAKDKPGMGCTAPAGSVMCRLEESVFALNGAALAAQNEVSITVSTLREHARRPEMVQQSAPCCGRGGASTVLIA